MQAMIRFGADEIFKSKDQTYTEEDIDAVLARGEEKTASLNENIKKTINNLRTFSINDSGKWETATCLICYIESNLYEFQGVDYGKEKKISALVVQPAKRERKAK
jgi:SWI/SNF-related matrix-associated actin-dependent regulator of chromatin subfamily A member 5